MKQRKKSSKQRDSKEGLVEGKDVKPEGIEDEKSSRELNTTKKMLVNGSDLNETVNNEEQVKALAKKNMNIVLHPEDVFRRLSSMFKELKLHWLQLSVKEENRIYQKKKDVSRLEYFNKELVACLTLVFSLAMLTRTYKVEEPPHVW